jgi:hypothetical protein
MWAVYLRAVIARGLRLARVTSGTLAPKAGGLRQPNQPAPLSRERRSPG